jgi:hypothetical protein
LTVIKAQLTAGLKPVVPLPSSPRLFIAIFLLSGMIACAGLIVFGGRGWQAMTPPARAIIFGPLFAAAGCTALLMVRSTFAEATHKRMTVACAAGMFALCVAGVLYQFDAHEERRFFVVGLRCLRAGLLYWFAAAACLAGLIHRAVVLRPVVMSAATGAMAALIAVAGSQIRCPNPNQMHSLAWHLSMLLLGLLSGMLAGVVVSNRIRAVTRKQLETK